MALSYPSICEIFQQMSFEKRLHLSRRAPFFQNMDRRYGYKMNALHVLPCHITIDQFLYISLDQCGPDSIEVRFQQKYEHQSILDPLSEYKTLAKCQVRDSLKSTTHRILAFFLNRRGTRVALLTGSTVLTSFPHCFRGWKNSPKVKHVHFQEVSGIAESFGSVTARRYDFDISCKPDSLKGPYMAAFIQNLHNFTIPNGAVLSLSSLGYTSKVEILDKIANYCEFSRLEECTFTISKVVIEDNKEKEMEQEYTLYRYKYSESSDIILCKDPWELGTRVSFQIVAKDEDSTLHNVLFDGYLKSRGIFD